MFTANERPSMTTVAKTILTVLLVSLAALLPSAVAEAAPAVTDGTPAVAAGAPNAGKVPPVSTVPSGKPQAQAIESARAAKSGSQRTASRASSALVQGVAWASNSRVSGAQAILQYWNGNAWMSLSSYYTDANGYYGSYVTPGYHYRYVIIKNWSFCSSYRFQERWAGVTPYAFARSGRSYNLNVSMTLISRSGC